MHSCGPQIYLRMIIQEEIHDFKLIKSSNNVHFLPATAYIMCWHNVLVCCVYACVYMHVNVFPSCVTSHDPLL